MSTVKCWEKILVSWLAFKYCSIHDRMMCNFWIQSMRSHLYTVNGNVVGDSKTYVWPLRCSETCVGCAIWTTSCCIYYVIAPTGFGSRVCCRSLSSLSRNGMRRPSFICPSNCSHKTCQNCACTNVAESVRTEVGSLLVAAFVANGNFSASKPNWIKLQLLTSVASNVGLMSYTVDVSDSAFARRRDNASV